MVGYSQRGLLTICLIFLICCQSFGQSINLKPKSEEFVAEGQTLKGYALTFDFTKKEIFKAWWKYSREFSRNQTKKNEIKHTIPPKEGESTIPIIFFSRVDSPDSLSAKIIAALSDNGMTSDNYKKYDKQVKELLIEFKVSYYKNNLQRKIDQTEKIAGKIGRSLVKYNSKSIKLEQKLVDTREEKRAHQKAIIENDSTISYLSKEITLTSQNKDSVSLELENIQKKLEELRALIGNIR